MGNYQRLRAIPMYSILIFIFQGTWFYQVAFVLYPPWGLSKWDEFDHRQMMLVTMIFAWHVGLTVIFQIGVAFIVYRQVRYKRKGANIIMKFSPRKTKLVFAIVFSGPQICTLDINSSRFILSCLSAS